MTGFFVAPVPEWQQKIRARCEVAGHRRLAIDSADSNSTIPERFQRVVAQMPDRPAVVTAQRVLTYAQLYAAVNQAARAVAAQVTDDPAPVAILVDDPVDAVIAQFGILQAGRAYVVLDRHSPLERLRQILDDAGSRVLVTHSTVSGEAHELTQERCTLLCLDATADYSTEAYRVPVSPDSMAALFYTSGTTGRPKGVMRDQRTNLHQVLVHAATSKLHIDDRCAWVSSSGFAASLSEVYSTLLAGASLYPCDVRRLMGRTASWQRATGRLKPPPLRSFSVPTPRTWTAKRCLPGTPFQARRSY